MTEIFDARAVFEVKRQVDRILQRKREGALHAYQRAAIREDVCIVTLAHALASHGLTISNDPDLGLVIHPLPREAA
jgi:hypothetical protein